MVDVLPLVEEIQMSRDYFYRHEENIHNRLAMLKDLVAEQPLHHLPCPLLANQLNELSVICGKLQDDIRRLRSAVEEATHG